MTPDEQSVATEYGLTAAEAQKELAAQDTMDTIDYRSLDPGFASISSSLGNPFTIEYDSSSESPDAVLKALDEADLLQYTKVHLVPYSLSELMRAEETLATSSPQFPRNLDLIFDKGAVEVFVESMPDEATRKAMETEVQTDVVWTLVDKLDEEFVDGGRALPQCTAGFTVFKVGDYATKGLSSAGHCFPTGGSPTYQGYTMSPVDYITPILMFDYGWYGNSAATFTATAYMGTQGGGVRDVTARKARADINVGDSVCKHGMETGYTCGSIISKTYNPCGFLCTASWMRVQRFSTYPQMAFYGDSGGPVMWNGVALGIVQGGNDTGTLMTAMFQSYFDEPGGLGIRVLTQ